MEQNPYEAPQEPSGGPNQNAVLALRVFAILMWLVAALWLGFYVWERSRNEITAFGMEGVLVLFTLPICGFFLLGLCCWWRTWWLAAAGILMIAPFAVLAIWASVVTY